MVISGIGYCDIQGNFQFHKNLLEGLQIYNGSLLFGVYHPRSKYATEGDQIRYHFMISPIPYHVWPRTARYTLLLKQDDAVDGQTVGIQMISKYLHDNGVAIIYSFSNRSAHRYSTWDIHVCFDKIHGKDLLNVDLRDDYDESQSCYRKVLSLAIHFESQLKDQFSDILFSDDDDIDLKSCITRRVNTACHYFYHESEKLQKEFPDKAVAYKFFVLRYNNGNFKPNEGGIINEQIHALEPEKKGFQLPSICFAEADSHYMNLMIIIIPSSFKHQFFKLSVFHERISSNPDMNNSSKGLLHYITNSLSEENYKIWKSSTLIFEHRIKENDSYCNGKLSLFIEAKNKFSESQADNHRDNLEYLLKSLEENENKPEDLKHIRLVSRCEKVYPDLIERYFKTNRKSIKKKQFDVFISYSHMDVKYANTLYKLLKEEGCNVFMDRERNEAGEILSKKIEEGLNSSRELCLLLSKKSLKSNWVTTEWGAAWIQKKLIVPLLIDLKFKDLPKIDKRISEKISIEWPADFNDLRKGYAMKNNWKGDLNLCCLKMSIIISWETNHTCELSRLCVCKKPSDKYSKKCLAVD